MRTLVVPAEVAKGSPTFVDVGGICWVCWTDPDGVCRLSDVESLATKEESRTTNAGIAARALEASNGQT